MSIFVGAFLLAVCTLVVPTAHANIIDSTYGAGSGSFELGLYVDNGYGWMENIYPGNTTITGWTAGGPGNGVEWLSAPTFAADTGIHAVDLQYTTRSSIATVIPTVSGD